MKRLVFAALLGFLCSCGLMGKRVSEDDCVKWDEHYREVLEKGIKKRLSGCKDDDPAAKGYAKNVGQTIATNSDGLAQGCRSLVKIGSYTAEEEKCFMKGSDPKDWAKCTTKPTSALKMYFTGGETMVKTAEGFCKASSDDDSDEAPKKSKKKKKKSEDDDD